MMEEAWTGDLTHQNIYGKPIDEILISFKANLFKKIPSGNEKMSIKEVYRIIAQPEFQREREE